MSEALRRSERMGKGKIRFRQFYFEGLKVKRKPVTTFAATGKPKQNTRGKCSVFHSQLVILPVSEL
jgi:hypothetical protein